MPTVGFWVPLWDCSVCNKCKILINAYLAERSNLLSSVCMFWMCIYFWKSGTWRAGLVPNLALWGWWFPLVAENILSTSLDQDGWDRCHDLCLLWIHPRRDVYVWQQMYEWLVWEMGAGNSVAGWAFSFHHLVKCHQSLSWFVAMWPVTQLLSLGCPMSKCFLAADILGR